MITFADIQAAHARIREQIVRTATLRSVTLSHHTGADVWLKFENTQFTSSFKERGALNKLLRLPEALRAGGVITMSAGNHAQALAYHAERLGVHATIVMPRSTPNAKVEQTRVFGCEVILHGDDFDETLRFTESLQRERNLTLVHPFDDWDVIAGQGTVGVELLEAVPDLDVVLIPVGGGGLISGCALAIKSIRPATQVVGVEAQRYASVFEHRFKRPMAEHGNTIAEGIAVKAPGRHALALIDEHVDDLVTVTEESMEDAVCMLLEVEKTVVEGAGAAAFAALLEHPDRFRGAKVGVVLSGGNIDMMILSSVLQRGLARSNRLVQLTVEIRDLPGSLGQLTALFGELESNIVEIEHHRAFGASSARTTLVECVLQVRGEEQVGTVLKRLQEEGYKVVRGAETSGL